MALGALFIAIGLAIVMFGTSHIAVYLPLTRTVSEDLLVFIGFGILMVAGGIYACVEGAQEPGARASKE